MRFCFLINKNVVHKTISNDHVLLAGCKRHALPGVGGGGVPPGQHQHRVSEAGVLPCVGRCLQDDINRGSQRSVLTPAGINDSPKQRLVVCAVHETPVRVCVSLVSGSGRGAVACGVRGQPGLGGAGRGLGLGAAAPRRLGLSVLLDVEVRAGPIGPGGRRALAQVARGGLVT